MSCDDALNIAKGTKYNYLAQLSGTQLVYKAISAKLGSTPLTLTVTGHGMPATWDAAFTDIGYADLNASAWPPEDDADFYIASKVDADTVKFNDIDLARLTGTFANGSIAYRTPIDLSGASAVLNIYDMAGTLIVSIAAVLDNTAKTIAAVIDTASIAVGSYTFVLLYTDAAGAPTEEDQGDLIVYALGSTP